ncbi:MAG: rhodanese-like domain-containing protein [Deltaproteobacteria bacterium]|nr:rhodanese-like domain-containing protein [Deltaproteobacteria bacterium]
MKIKSLFLPVPNMTADEARSFMEEQKEGSYTLLDVRQEREYAKERIPEAKLIPLPQLPDRLGEIDREKPVIVY